MCVSGFSASTCAIVCGLTLGLVSAAVVAGIISGGAGFYIGGIDYQENPEEGSERTIVRGATVGIILGAAVGILPTAFSKL